MGASLTCCACGRTADASEGYLRPEGFVCGTCWTERLKDPAFVLAMETELAGLISVASGDTSDAVPAPGAQAVPAPRTERDRRAVESLLGLAVADALGAPWEGSDTDSNREVGLIGRAAGITPWTDDTQMALSIVEVLEQAGRIEQDTLAAAFARRYERWRGYGSGMHVVLSALREGGDWRKVRHSVFRDGSFGNGSAMRAGPIGAFFFDAPVDEVAKQAELSAEITHSHLEGRAGAIAVAVAAWLAARSRGAPPRAGSELLRMVISHVPSGSGVAEGLAKAAELARPTPLEVVVPDLGNGSRVACQDTVPLALWLALHRLGDYEAAVRLAVAAGGDTDTIAAIVGSIVAAYGGLSCIPSHWRSLVEPVPFVGGKA